ncbi:sulfide/dihydroorotate dehydrogenase-like FAD/NAD-binding protein [Propionicimonas sp.]|uniref:sulfide/dihydroorotate dehydrogenase-like FAD/NAD-binding protein n=1 Tax=Propionicimonas sp. TaxID=1955623 RepID=UPI0025F69E5F|nr:sulfide/dihydroorotate dehydrogenase-like FAD/NAD-binding protein [Propionicimonas sp.]MCG2804673.1 sulfide/dihydroorotate dehydrogenase-like FAD/NAD-binding protein [Propionicimonas sp.]
MTTEIATDTTDVMSVLVNFSPATPDEPFTEEQVSAITEALKQPEFAPEFTEALWAALLREDAGSLKLMGILWELPMARKRGFMKAVDTQLSARYPMFAGTSEKWPSLNGIGPYIREPEARNADFELVNKGYLGYMDLGYSRREVELFVWLEALRDMQCAKQPCVLGVLTAGQVEPDGGCPVSVNIPAMFELIGTGQFRKALESLEAVNPLPNVTGRVCPQELQCQSHCIHKHSMSIGQLEWFLPEWEKLAEPEQLKARFAGRPNPWELSTRPPVAIVGSGPAGLITAYLLAADGFPVTIFEAFPELGGVLRYGIPEFRLPNQLIDDVVFKIKALGGRFVTNFVVGKTATIDQLREAGFVKVFVGSGAGLPRFLNVPGEHLLNVMSANEFLTRVNLMQAHTDDHETPLPVVPGKEVLIIGGGNTAMDAARTSQRLGGKVTIVYRRTQAEMPARLEELEHALEEGIVVSELRSPVEFLSTNDSHFVTTAVVEKMALGEPDESGRRRPVATGETEQIAADLVIMALGNDANPIIKDSEPRLQVSKWGTINQVSTTSKETTLPGVYTGGDAARGGSTAIRAAGDGQSAAREMVAAMEQMTATEISSRVDQALTYTDLAAELPVIISKTHLSEGIEEFEIRSPSIARTAQAGQFVRVLAEPNGELIPLTLADWDAEAGTITLVVQGMGTSSLKMNKMTVGEAFAGIAGPLGQPSALERYSDDSTVVFTAGGLGLPPVYPIMRAHLRLGNHVTLISGFRSKELMFWDGEAERVGAIKAEFGDQLEVIYATNDGSFGIHGFVTTPLTDMLEANKAGEGRKIAEVVTIGPPLMMRAVADLTRGYDVHTVASLNSIMVDATGMCGACMVPVNEAGKLVRKHACIDGPEIDGHAIDWDKFLPRFGLFKAQEQASRARNGL